MATLPTTTVRIDPAIRAQAVAVFDQLGISTSAAINAFLRAVVRTGGIPFELRIPIAQPPRPAKNVALNLAGTSRNDEFFTEFKDVEAELSKYAEGFRGKRIYCNCDDPMESAFVKFFVLNFNSFGIKELVVTSYSGATPAGQPSEYVPSKPGQQALITEVDDGAVGEYSGAIDWNRLFGLPGNVLENLEGDGDFRSDECVRLLKMADVVVTNPPFSLFREYVAQLMSHKKSFVILGNMNATTYKEVFPLFQQNKVWYGETIRSGDRKFFVPDTYPLNASGCGVDELGRRFIRVKGVRWFTNLDNGRRHQQLQLTATFEPMKYPIYENYDAIEVGRVADIPADYDGLMGVPITFLDKFCPDQFEIVMLANGNARTNVSAEALRKAGYKAHVLDKGGVGIINGQRSYARILLRRKSS